MALFEENLVNFELMRDFFCLRLVTKIPDDIISGKFAEMDFFLLKPFSLELLSEFAVFLEAAMKS